MKKTIMSIALVLLGSIGTASAAQFHFDGNIAYHNDVVTINFSLANDATNVRVWTDSFLTATNFDPITALWNQATGAKIAENDDDDTVNPATQTYYDSGFSLPTLAAGNYFFTVATYANFALGSNISDGFNYDGETPIPLALWDQPSSHLGMGTYWSVRLDGVDSANVAATPIPAAMWLFGSAVAGLIGINRRKKAA